MAGTLEKGGEVICMVPSVKLATQESVLWDFCQALAESFPLGLTPRISRKLLLGGLWFSCPSIMFMGC